MGLQKLLSMMITLVWMLPQQVAAGPLTIEQAVQKAKRHTGGKVLAAKHFSQGQQDYFRIKLLLDNGRIKTLYVNKDSGQVLDKKP